MFIDDVEWKVAEVTGNIVTLYREAIGGENHTIQKTVEEIKILIPEKT